MTCPRMRRLAVLVSCVALLAAGSVASAARADETTGGPSGAAACGPFSQTEAERQQLAAASARLMTARGLPGASQLADASGSPIPSERGISAGGGGPGGATALGPGTIERLPAAGVDRSTASSPSEASEAILALPKNEAGQIPSDFELGPGAEIARSFFSPVICATVARVAGPPGASIDQLVTVVPDGSALVPNDVYSSAASELKPIGQAEPPARQIDPYEPLQYGLAISGVREARGLGAGLGVTIALLDSAPETDHLDLAEARIAPVAEATDSLEEVGVHGTLMAGVISATENNGFGIAGMAPDAALVSIPICTPTAGGAGGRCTIFRLLQGLDRAWRAEAEIVNLALSGPPNVLLERGMARLETLGSVVVAAAGNEGTDEKRYPAAYPTVIGVGAVDRQGQRFAASNFGSWVEIAAPGVDVLSTIPGNAFAFGNGTSLAAAHVTGAIAVIASVTGDVQFARGELFRAAHAAQAGGRTRTLPSVCEVLERSGIACAPETAPPAGAAAAETAR